MTDFPDASLLCPDIKSFNVSSFIFDDNEGVMSNKLALSIKVINEAILDEANLYVYVGNTQRYFNPDDY